MTSLVTVSSMEQDGSQVRWPALWLSPHREANMTRYTATKLPSQTHGPWETG